MCLDNHKQSTLDYQHKLKQRNIMDTSRIGLYLVNAGIFRIKANKDQTNLYALKLTNSGEWEYAPGAVHKLRPETKMTLEQAKHYGRKTGTCIMCFRTLTNPDSIEAGIGPICADKF